LVRMHTRALTDNYAHPLSDPSICLFQDGNAICGRSIRTAGRPSPSAAFLKAYPGENDRTAAADQPILITSASEDGPYLPLPLDAFL
jgi:hypothetical protein